VASPYLTPLTVSLRDAEDDDLSREIADKKWTLAVNRDVADSNRINPQAPERQNVFVK
jgi:hypothetical protein